MKSAKRAKVKASSSNQYGRAWRGLLRELVRAKVKTREDREALAKAMNISVHHVASMFYRDEGGFDSWAQAVSIAYDLKIKDIDGLFVLLKQTFRKSAPLSKSDEVWTKLDEIVDENEKFYWVSLLQALITADRDLGHKRTKK